MPPVDGLGVVERKGEGAFAQRGVTFSANGNKMGGFPS